MMNRTNRNANQRRRAVATQLSGIKSRQSPEGVIQLADDQNKSMPKMKAALESKKPTGDSKSQPAANTKAVTTDNVVVAESTTRRRNQNQQVMTNVM